MDASKRINSYSGEVRPSHKHKQSKAVIPSRSIQDAMSKRWEIEPLPLYLVRDPDGNTLRLYKDLNRARNWTKGTSRAIIYNQPAKEIWERNHSQSGNFVMMSLLTLAILYGCVWVLFTLAGLI